MTLATPNISSPSTGRAQKRTPHSRKWGVVALLVAAALLALVVVHARCQGIRLTAADFTPQADEQRVERGWAMIRPGSTGSTSASPEAGMPLLRTTVDGETASAKFDIQSTGSLDLWIAGKPQDHNALTLALTTPQGPLPLKLIGARQSHRSDLVWARYLAADAHPGDYTLQITAAPDRSPNKLSQFGDVVLIDHDRHPLFSLQSAVYWNFLRAAAIALLLIGLGSFTRLARRPWHLLMLAIAFATFIEYYIPTANWGMTDDTFYYLTDQSSLRDGDLSGLFIRHQGHVMPVYRALIEISYALSGMNPWLERAIAAASTLLGAWLLHRLTARWTGSATGATIAVCLYLTNHVVHAEQICLTSADSLPPCMLCIIGAMAALDQYLRRRRLCWLILSGISALMAPLIYAGGILAYPALVLQLFLFGSPKILHRREWLRIVTVFAISMLLFVACYAAGHQPASAPVEAIPLPKTVNQVFALINKCGLAFLYGLQSILAHAGINDGLGLFIFIILVLPLFLFSPSRRPRRSFLAGLLLILPVYFMIFGIRVDEYVHKSHYQILAFIGFTTATAASAAVWARGGRLRQNCVKAVSLVILIYLAGQLITLTTSGFQTWNYLLDRQRLVLDAIAAPLRTPPLPASALDLGRYEVSHITATSRITASHAGALLMHQRFDAPVELKVPTDSALASPITRSIYRNLALYSVDELRLPQQSSSAILLADGVHNFPTHSLFSLSFPTTTDAHHFDSLALLELPNGLDRPQGRWGAWLSRSTRLRLYTPVSGTLTLNTQLTPGISDPRPRRTVTVSCASAKNSWTLEGHSDANYQSDLPVRAGLNDIFINVLEPPPFAVQPNGDTRDLMLWCSALHLKLIPH